MSAGSLIVALYLTYVTAGVPAPALLLAARVRQGVALGGEYGASVTYLSGIGTARHRNRYVDRRPGEARADSRLDPRARGGAAARGRGQPVRRHGGAA